MARASLKVVVDTNVLIDYLNGIPQAKAELARYRDARISLVTWMEVLVGARSEHEEQVLGQFLAGFTLINVDIKVAKLAVEKRRKYRIRLPDAIIWATAEACGLLLVTRNSRDFPAEDPGIRVPYQL